MTNCVLNVLRSVGSFLVGSLRIILFFGCLLALLIQIIVVGMLFHVTPDPDLKLPGTEVKFSDYALGVSLLVLAFLGAYGSFYKHHPSIKAFSLLTALNVTVIIVIALMSPQRFQKENEEFGARMRDLAEQYTWSQDWLYGQNEADRAWNKLQKLFCCGLNGPDDWVKNRPSKVPSDSYPTSCCLHGGHSPIFELRPSVKYCRKNEVFGVGCMERVQQIEAFSLLFCCLYIAYQLALCILACVVGNFNLERPRPAQNPEAGNTGRSGYAPTEYQRFEGSVYVRQPPVNEHHQPTKADLPPLYPSIHDVERTTYVGPPGPPPSYGTTT